MSASYPTSDLASYRDCVTALVETGALRDIESGDQQRQAQALLWPVS